MPSLSTVDRAHHHPDLAWRVLDLAPAVVFVVDPELRITFTNRTAAALIGYDRDEVIGRSVLDFLDPDWNPAAFRSIATALGSDGGQRLPTTFRAIAKDGTRTIIEATANVQLDDPLVNGVVVYARVWNERWLLDRTLESVAAGDPIEATMSLLVEVAGAETMEADASFVFDPDDDGGFLHTIASDALAAELRGPTPDVAADVRIAWHDLLVGAEGCITNLDELPGPLRTLADAQGYRALWAWPARGDAGAPPGVWAIGWRRELHLEADEARTGMMAHLATLAGLALTRTRTEERHAHAALRDTMTGLWNRNAIYDVVTDALATDGAPGIGVVYLDLDRFKPVNDRFGHAAGDRVLAAVAERLDRACPEDGRVGRFGGDEFVAVFPAADLDEVERVAARLAAVVVDPVELRSGETVTVGVSTGAAFAEPGTTTADELIELADDHLYRIKRARPTSG